MATAMDGSNVISETRFPTISPATIEAARDAKKVARVKYQYWDQLDTPEKSA